MSNKAVKQGIFQWNPYRIPLMKLALPIVLQNLLSSAVSSMDVIMLNFVGQDAISAVSLAAQMINIVFMFYYGLGTGATMLCAQYYGKGNLEAVKVVQGIAMRISISISVILALCCWICPGAIMFIFTNDPVLIEMGTQYLRFVAPAFLCWGISEIFLSVLRSIGRVTIAMVLNMLAFGLNILFNAIFIFGLFGAPKMEAAGVALGTSLSRLIQLIACIVVSMKSRDLKLEPRYLFVSNKLLTKDFFHMAVPALLNDIVWGLAFSVYSVILGHLGTDAVAANSLTTVVRGFGTTICFGMSSACGIMLGQILGDGKIREAEQAAKEAVLQTMLGAAIGSIAMRIAIPFILMFAALTETAMGYLKGMLWINCYYIFGAALNTTLICGVFRSGGDSKFGFKVDLVDMWMYAVPLGLLTAFVLKLPVMWVYFFMCTDEFVKWPWVIRHYLQKKWLTNITRDDWNKN